MNLISLLLLSILCLQADPLTRSERDQAMSHLHASRKLLADSVAGLSGAQLKYKTAPDRWSVADCVEHLALSEDLLFGRVQQLLSAPAGDKRATIKDDQILKMIASREQKVQAPEPLKPSGKFASATEALEAFNKSRYKTIAFVEKTQDELRARTSPFLNNTTMDAYQSLLMISAHTERHVAQINEVKADPKFPKK